MMLYIEMLAHAHLDPSFVTDCADVSLRRSGDRVVRKHIRTNASSSKSERGTPVVTTERIKQYLSAARQIENLICTSRESLLGSSAWTPTFLAALKSRPFYYVTDVSQLSIETGTRYNSLSTPAFNEGSSLDTFHLLPPLSFHPLLSYSLS